MSRRVLLVDPNTTALESLRQAIALRAETDTRTNFPTARAQLLSKQYDLLVTNLRLQAHNGLHLVYVAQSVGAPTRSVVYTDRREPPLAREVQRAGAFYESAEGLPYALEGYLQSSLPAADRRDGSAADRREKFRGGRRCSDLPVVAMMLGMPIAG